MKFSEARTETQVVLMGSALAGVIGVFARDEEDEGRKLLETALSQIGLTPDEFQTLMTDLPPEVETEVETFNRLAEEDDQEDMVVCPDCDRFVEDCCCHENDVLDTMEERPGIHDYNTEHMDKDGWENI